MCCTRYMPDTVAPIGGDFLTALHTLLYTVRTERHVLDASAAVVVDLT